MLPQDSVDRTGPGRKQREDRRQREFFAPGRCDCWIIAALVSSSTNYFHVDEFKEYITAFVEHCKMKGIKIGRPEVENFVLRATVNDVKKQFMLAKEVGATFIHFITSEELHLHEDIKLLECREQIVTQNVTTVNAVLVPKTYRILNSIVGKVNLKLGGNNYEVKLEPLAEKLVAEETLVVGIDHFRAKLTAQWDPPSAVGYSSNIRSKPMEFVGGYRYAWIDRKELDLKADEEEKVICDLIEESIEKFLAGGFTFPKNLIVFRQGLSSEQLPYAMEFELPQVLEACSKVGSVQTLEPLVTFVALLRLGRLDSFRQRLKSAISGSPEEIMSSEEVENLALYKFFHAGLLYVVLYNSANIPKSELQSLVRSLTHQTAEESFPIPCRNAFKMMKRSCLNFGAMFPDDSKKPKLPTLRRLNNDLGYMDKPLGNCLFSA